MKQETGRRVADDTARSEERRKTERGIPIETARTGSFTMKYFRFGKGAETLVILPGLSVQSVMGSADAVAEAYRLLAEHYTVYLLDRRSELPVSYTAQDMARDTAEAIRALGLEKTNLFGVSQGGMIALELAIRHPELINKLIVGSTAARMTEERRKAVNLWIEAAKAGNAEELYLSFGRALYPEKAFAQSRGLLVEAAKTVTEKELRRFVLLAEAMKDYDVTDELEKIACPVLVIGAKDDRILGPDAAGEIAERLRGRTDFEICLYDGYGHAAYDLAPDYKERLLRFLSKHEIRQGVKENEP